jgi:hypothetical protein
MTDGPARAASRSDQKSEQALHFLRGIGLDGRALREDLILLSAGRRWESRCRGLHLRFRLENISPREPLAASSFSQHLIVINEPAINLDVVLALLDKTKANVASTLATQVPPTADLVGGAAPVGEPGVDPEIGTNYENLRIAIDLFSVDIL